MQCYLKFNFLLEKWLFDHYNKRAVTRYFFIVYARSRCRLGAFSTVELCENRIGMLIEQ